MVTATFEKTNVLGARIGVIAFLWAGADACTIAADIGCGAGVVIIALKGVVVIYTSGSFVATVGGAVVAVVAVDINSGTRAIAADVARSARIVVTAWQRIGVIVTTVRWVTIVCRTHVLVITLIGVDSDTLTLLALSLNGAGITVIAGHLVGDVLTLSVHTGIIRARIFIVTDDLFSGLAKTFDTRVTGCTRITVRAECIDVIMPAAVFR